ncbi:hypothetical protein [Paenibacillus ginsengihumi]|uniref:hypothetical protein n=1 Tax=Paenibacillus ginsengihumi TaxID=431596 RepID=UPI00037D9F54|nr:hypothetical protein [Paenibacillus ginsengihumi]
MPGPAQPPQAPLFRDPIHDGAADPTVIWNREAKEWWTVAIHKPNKSALERPHFLAWNGGA